MSEHRIAIWNLLHDGTLDRTERCGGDLQLEIRLSYLATRALPGSSGLKLTLHGCTSFAFVAWESSDIVTDLRSISNLELGILSTDSESRPIDVITDRGVLKVDFSDLSIELENGSPISFEELQEIAKGYWDDFSNRPCPCFPVRPQGDTAKRSGDAVSSKTKPFSL